jgi:hypothetical protein
MMKLEDNTNAPKSNVVEHLLTAETLDSRIAKLKTDQDVQGIFFIRWSRFVSRQLARLRWHCWGDLLWLINEHIFVAFHCLFQY